MQLSLVWSRKVDFRLSLLCLHVPVRFVNRGSLILSALESRELVSAAKHDELIYQHGNDFKQGAKLNSM